MATAEKRAAPRSAMDAPTRTGAPSGGAGDADDAAHRLDDGVVRGSFRVGTGVPESGDGGVDQTGVEILYGFVVQAEALHSAGAEVLEQYIRHRDELLQDLLRLQRAEIQGDPSLAPVHAVEVHALALLEGPHLPGVVPHAGQFDLDHLRAQIGEQHPRVGAGQHSGDVEDSDSG